MTYHYSRPNSVYTQNLTSSRPQSVYTQNLTQSSSASRPYSVYTQSHHQRQSSTASRPYSVVGYEGLSSLQPQSFRVIRRRQQRKNSRNNVLNPTLDNFYNILRRTEADLNVKSSAKDWLNEYESYRRQVINAEKSNVVENIRPVRPVSCYSSTLVSSPTTMDNPRYSMQF